MLNDDLKWKAVMLFAAILADDGNEQHRKGWPKLPASTDAQVIEAALLPIDAAGVRSEVVDALRAAADRIDAAKEGARLETDLRRRTLALVAAVSDQDEDATDKLLATFDPDGDDGDEVLEVLGLAQHVLDVRMGYESGCADEDTPDDPPVIFPTDFM